MLLPVQDLRLGRLSGHLANDELLLEVAGERYNQVENVDPVRNPYAPGAGGRPAALVGRDAQLAEGNVALQRVEAGLTAQPNALCGLHGVGNTVWSFGLDLSQVGGGGADTGVLEVHLTKVLQDVAVA
ncbi:MAG: hypothetical protein M0013_03610 [Actinomycetota bacterium]|nr:hypothetical protein [Actinomycetota bacterium]